MQVFIRKPMIDLFSGIIVTKDTVLDFKNDKVEQTVKDLVFHSKTKVTGKTFTSIQDTTIQLEEGDVLIFEEDDRGYIKPVEHFVTIAEAIDDLTNIKDLG